MSWSITSMFDAIIIPWNSVVDIQVYVKESSNLWPGSNNSKLLECFAAASWHGNKLFWAKQPPHQHFSTWSHCIDTLPAPPKYFQIKQRYNILVRTLSNTLAQFDAVLLEPHNSHYNNHIYSLHSHYNNHNHIQSNVYPTILFSGSISIQREALVYIRWSIR